MYGSTCYHDCPGTCNGIQLARMTAHVEPFDWIGIGQNHILAYSFKGSAAN